MNLKVSYFNLPVPDLKAARSFYRDQLGFEETWREGDEACAFALPGTTIQLMLIQREPQHPDRAGLVFLIPSVDDFYEAQQSAIRFHGKPVDIPGNGRWVGALDATGHGLYFADIE